MLRMNWFLRPVAIFVAQAFLLAFVLSTWPVRAQTSESAQPSLASRQDTYRALSGFLDRFYSAVEVLNKTIDATRFDIDALARRLGPDPKAMLAFVQRQIRFDPYVGSLRGARGALQSGGANSLDRSLLLASLLKRSGFKVEIAEGRLDEARSRHLLERVGKPGPTRPEELKIDAPFVQDLVQSLGIKVNDLIEAVEKADKNSKANAAELYERYTQDAEFLTDRLKAAGIAMPAPRTIDSLIPVVSDHFWVRYQNTEGQWFDLDPSFLDFAAGRSIGQSQATFAANALPERLIHRLHIRMILRTANGVVEGDHVVMDKNLSVADLYGVTIHVINQPLPSPYEAMLAGKAPADALSGVNEFVPVVNYGDHRVIGKFFTTQGEIFDDPPGSDTRKTKRLKKLQEKGFANPTKTLNTMYDNAGQPRQSAKQRIVAETVEFEIDTPTSDGTRSLRTERRLIYTARAANKALPSKSDIVQGLVWSDDLLAITGPVTGDYLGYSQVNSILAGRDQAMGVLRQLLGLPADQKSISKSRAYLISPLVFATGLTENLAAILPARFPHLRVVWDRAQLVALETSQTQRSGSSAITKQGYDIIALKPTIVALGPANDDAGLALTIGALANALEWSLAAHRFDLFNGTAMTWVANAGEVLRAAMAQNLNVIILRPQDDRVNALAQLTLPPDETEHIAIALDRGSVVIAPAMPVAIAGADFPSFGWWEVNFKTGEVLGRMEGGRGAAEYTALQSTLYGGIAFGACVGTVFISRWPHLEAYTQPNERVSEAACLFIGLATGYGFIGTAPAHDAFIATTALGIFIALLEKAESDYRIRLLVQNSGRPANPSTPVVPPSKQ